MITIRINEDDLLDALVERVSFWTNDEDVLRLFEKYYEANITWFDGLEVNIMEIVDNDYVNWTHIGDEDDIPEYGEDNILARHNDLVLFAA